jgi:hypothetical protein
MLSTIKNIVNNINAPSSTSQSIPPSMTSTTLPSGMITISNQQPQLTAIVSSGGGGGIGSSTGNGFFHSGFTTQKTHLNYERGLIEWSNTFMVELSNSQVWQFHMRVWMECRESEGLRFATTTSGNRHFLVFDDPVHAETFRRWKSKYSERYNGHVDNVYFPTPAEGTHTFTVVDTRNQIRNYALDELWAWVTDNCGPVNVVTNPSDLTLTVSSAPSIGFSMLFFKNLTDAINFKIRWMAGT